MFRFAHPMFLYLLALLVPVVVGQLTPDVSVGKHWLKFILIALAYVFLVLALASPQLGTHQEKVKRQGIDVVIAIDVSKSMLAEDVQPNRLARAKNFISNFTDELRNDRLAIVVFAGKAYLQMPLTVDYSAAKMYLKTIGTESVPTQGTSISDAVDIAKESFAKGDNKSKALIIISDGEDNEAGVEEAVEQAAKDGVKVFTLAVGSDKGSPIPLPTGDFKRDEAGNIVLSKVNYEAMRGYATKGNGKSFVLGSGKDEIAAILKELGRINTKDFEEMLFTDYDDKFQYCLLIALLLLAVEYLLSERKSKWITKLKI
jgi:Ca-activated chloride channel homolog